jgi:hypothetical protein
MKTFVLPFSSFFFIDTNQPTNPILDNTKLYLQVKIEPPAAFTNQLHYLTQIRTYNFSPETEGARSEGTLDGWKHPSREVEGALSLRNCI